MKNLYQQTLDSNSFGDKSDGRLIQVELVIEMRWRHLGQVPNPKNEIFAKNCESDTMIARNFEQTLVIRVVPNPPLYPFELGTVSITPGTGL